MSENCGVRQRRFGSFDYALRLRRMVAVCRRYPVKNRRIGSCISVAFQFLGLKNRKRSFKFCRSFRLFLPKAVWHLLVRPANQVRRHDVRNSASQAFPFHNIEITGRRFRVRSEFRI